MEGAAAAAEVASPIAAPAPPAETKQKILVLGATGPTGISTIQIALQRGHSVVAYVRNPGKLPKEIQEDDRVTIVRGELTETSKLFPLLSDITAIISHLGPTLRSTPGPLTTFYSALLAHLRTLPASSRPRILALGTLSIAVPGDRRPLMHRVLVTAVWVIGHSAWREFVGIGEVFRMQGEGVRWTVFRAGYMSEAPATGKVRAGWSGGEGWGIGCSKKDYAGWCVREAERPRGEERWVGEMPCLWPVEEGGREW